MQDSYKKLTEQVNTNLAALRSEQKDVMNGFASMAKAAMKPGLLDTKTKELIALAIAVADRCDPCIAFHTKALVDLGATIEEVREALTVNVYMGGGPSLMYSASAIASFEEFKALKK